MQIEEALYLRRYYNDGRVTGPAWSRMRRPVAQVLWNILTDVVSCRWLSQMNLWFLRSPKAMRA